MGRYVLLSGWISPPCASLPTFSSVTVTRMSKSEPFDCIFATISSGVSKTVYSTSTPYRSPNWFRTFFQT